MNRLTVRRFAFAVGCVSLAFACTLFNPLDQYGPPRPTSAEAAVDAAPEAAPCRTAHWPARSDKDDPADVAPGELVFALATAGMGNPPDAGHEPPVGFDLDGVCTCPEAASCVAPKDAHEACDLDGGIDIAGTELLRRMLGGVGFDMNERLGSGERGLLIRLRNYNGGANDRQVEVSVFASGGNEGVEDGGTPKRPALDGTDRWTLEPASLVGGAGPPYAGRNVDTNAYVAGNMLVASLDFPLSLSEIAVRLHGTNLIAKLERQGASYRLVDGRLVGRWATKDLLTSLDALTDPSQQDRGLCGDSGLYRDIKREVCASVDLVSDPKQDGTSAPCDALGSVFVFTAAPAQLGAVFTPAPRPGKCGPAWADDCAPK